MFLVLFPLGPVVHPVDEVCMPVVGQRPDVPGLLDGQDDVQPRRRATRLHHPGDLVLLAKEEELGGIGAVVASLVRRAQTFPDSAFHVDAQLGALHGLAGVFHLLEKN